VPVLLPANYVAGIGAVARVADESYRYTYLGGERRRGGFWHYYLYAYGVKLPLGTLALFTLTLLSLLDQRRLPSGTSRAGLVRGQRQFNAGLFPRPDTQCCSADYRAPRSGQRPPLPRARSPSHGTPVLVAAGLGTPKDIGVGNCPRGPDLALSLLAQADSRPYLLAEVNLQFAITNLQFAMNPAAHRDNVRNDTPNAAMSPSPSECHPLDCGCFKMQNAKCKMTSGSIIQAVRPGKARRPPEEHRLQ
jgi:hypothetical protein